MDDNKAAQQPSAAHLWEVYCELGSLRAVGSACGISRDKAHRILRQAGYSLKGGSFTAAEDEIIRRFYAGTPHDAFRLDDLVEQLNRDRKYPRSKQNICRRAREIGAGTMHRPMLPEARKVISEKAQERLKTSHPKGYLGKKHSEATRAILGEKSRQGQAAMTEDQKAAKTLKMMKTKETNGTVIPPRHKASWKQGWREIAGRRVYFRSQWEVNYARYLQWLKEKGEIIEWEFEPETFWFEGVKRGTVSYLPDFRVTEKNGERTYHEIKGWMDARSQTKLKRMAKYHPHIKLILVDSKAYSALQKQVQRLVPGWE